MGRSQSLPRGGDPHFGADGDDQGCTILHVDMDAFFAAVEVRRRPELRGRPVIVGGTGPRGVVSSASYEARRYGVRSAMPTSRARSLCPRGVFLSPEFAAYSAVSRAVMEIFREVTPLVEPISSDEAFLDVAGARRLFGRPVEIARRIRARVAEQERLTCSVGVASTKFVAKLASTRSKPDGLLVVPAARTLEFLHPLPVGALWGVGERAEQTLRRLGLTTVGEVAQAPPRMLRDALGEAAAAHLTELAQGRDPRRVSPDRVEKSIGAETTFDTDVTDRAVLRRTLLWLAEKVGARLRAAGQVGRVVSIKIRYEDFRTISRSRTLENPTDVAREILTTGWQLLTALDPVTPVRLVGIRVERLAAATDAPRQLVFGEPEHGWREAEAAADAVVARFGRSAVRPASLLEPTGEDQRENPSR